MYPEMLIFENNTYRTGRINEAIRLICKPEKVFKEYKKGMALKNESHSNCVVPTGKLSNYFFIKIAKIRQVYSYFNIIKLST
jgi:hypothetical protein